MGTTTFSGPIRAGNIRNTVGTTLGSDVANVGYVVMMQTHTMDLSGGAIAAGSTDMVIPANSKIIDVVVDLATAANVTTNISVGDTVGGATTILTGTGSQVTVTIPVDGAETGAGGSEASDLRKLNTPADLHSHTLSGVTDVKPAWYALAFIIRVR